jgi:hypothetical protein
MKKKILPGCIAGWSSLRALTNKIRITPSLLALCLILSFPVFTFAADIISAQSGPWTSSYTWTGGVVPAQGDNVTIKSGHSVTIPSSGTKACTNLTIENGGLLYANAGGAPRYMDVYGNITCDGTIGNGSTLDAISFNIEAVDCMISGSGVFDASRIRKNTGVNSVTTLHIAMNITLRYAGTAIFNNKTASNFHIIIDAGATLDCAGNSGSPANVCIDGSNGSNGSSFGGSITVNGTLVVTGILYLTTDNNSGTYSVSFTINNGGIVNTASVVCTNSGSAGHTTTINDGGLLNFSSGDWGTIGTVNNAYIFSSSSTIEYSGDVAQTVGNPADYGQLLISGTGEKSSGTNEIKVNSDLTVQSGSRFVIPRSGRLTVEGNIQLNSAECLVLKAGQGSSAPGSLIGNGSFIGPGTVLVEKFIPKYNTPDDPNYHLVSSPVVSQNIQPEFVNDPPDSTTDFYRWDEISGVWMNSKTSSGLWNTSFQPGDDRTFNPGRGYLLAYNTDVIKNFNGSIWNSDLNVPVTYTSAAGAYAGYNLVGNPFTSALNGDIQNWTKSNVQNALWVWSPDAGNYLVWNGLTGTLPDGVIPSMQGFFIKATGNSPSLVIPASSRVHNSQGGYKSGLENTLEITLSGSTWCDKAILYIPMQSQSIPDSLFNLEKFFGYRDAAQLYFLRNDNYFSIIQSDTTSREWVLPLGIQKGISDTLKFGFTGMEAFHGSEIYLEDRLNNLNINLLEEGSYQFISSFPEENDRFFLHYRNTTGSGDSKSPLRPYVFSAGNTIVINNADNSTTVEKLEIYDLIGSLVYSGIIPAGIRKINPDLASGYYFVRLTTGATSVTVKILLNR